MLSWAILMWGWWHSSSTLIWEWTTILGTFSQILNFLYKTLLHGAFNISEKLYFYAMEVLCNVPLVHTKACSKDVVSSWKRANVHTQRKSYVPQPSILFLYACQQETSHFPHKAILSGCLEQLQFQVLLAGFGNSEEQFLWPCSCPAPGLWRKHTW